MDRGSGRLMKQTNKAGYLLQQEIEQEPFAYNTWRHLYLSKNKDDFIHKAT
jgi:hypothetical protein